VALFTLSIGLSTTSIASVTDKAFERLFALSHQQPESTDSVDGKQEANADNLSTESALIQWLQQNPGIDLG